MDKQYILDEIHRTAKDGRAPGKARFLAETGIREKDWAGKYWARWGDALAEAGYAQNEWTISHGETHIIANLIALTRKLGKYPTSFEIDLERRANKSFPNSSTIRRTAGSAEVGEEAA